MGALQLGARLCESVRREMLQGNDPRKLDKDDRSPVTVADYGAQALICRTVSWAFPSSVIVAEEDSLALREAGHADLLDTITRSVAQQVGRVTPAHILEWIDLGNGVPADQFWVLDPIDGTKGYLRNEHYAVALAVIEEGVVTWGGLACPALTYGQHTGLILTAQCDEGAFLWTLEGDRLDKIQVSDIAQPKQARMAESVEAAHTNRGLAGQVKSELDMTMPSVLMDSQTKYAAVACGLAEIYLRSPNPKTPTYRENLWDHAAGARLVEEAGGTVTDVYGRPLDWQQGKRLEHNIGIVATNGQFHDELITTMSKFLPPLVS